MSSSDYGYPYYNKKKPKSYIMSLYDSKIESIDLQIKKLQIERQNIMDEIIKIKSTINQHETKASSNQTNNSSEP
jgi:chorismate mutase